MIFSIRKATKSTQPLVDVQDTLTVRQIQQQLWLPVKNFLANRKKNTVRTENFTWVADGKYRSRNQQFYSYNTKLLPSLCSHYREEINDRKRWETASVFVSKIQQIFFAIISSESIIKYTDFCRSQL